MADSNFSSRQLFGCVLAIVGLLITTPIWYWLVYQILVRVNATPTMWVFYWIYTPVGVLLAIFRVFVDGLMRKDTEA
jgi:hypothetical protein